MTEDEKKWNRMVELVCQRECHPAFEAFSAEQKAIIWVAKELAALREERDRLREAVDRVLESAKPYKAGGLPLQQKITEWTKAMDDLRAIRRGREGK